MILLNGVQTGEQRYRVSLFGKMILQVEIEYETEDPLDFRLGPMVKRWRDAKPTDFPPSFFPSFFPTRK